MVGKKKTLHVRKIRGKAIPAGKKAPPLNLLKGIKDLANQMFKKKYASQKEIAKDQKKLDKMVAKLPKNKKTKELKKKVKNINFWDDEERKQQLVDIITMVLGIILAYIDIKYFKGKLIAKGAI